MSTTRHTDTVEVILKDQCRTAPHRRLGIAKAISSSHTPARSSVATDKDATAPD
jgi:hypothetical protein